MMKGFTLIGVLLALCMGALFLVVLFIVVTRIQSGPDNMKTQFKRVRSTCVQGNGIKFRVAQYEQEGHKFLIFSSSNNSDIEVIKLGE